MQKRKHSCALRGFTLVELMVVVIIVGILAAVAVPAMTAMKNKAISSELIAAFAVIETACENYYTEHSMAPTDYTALENAGLINVSDLDGTFFAATDVETAVNSFTLGARGVNPGSGATKGITIEKEANGGFKVSGTYTP